MKRFYAESDGGPGHMSHYVVDRYADPIGDNHRTDCNTCREARALARQWNEVPPWPAWDTIQEARDSKGAKMATKKQPAKERKPQAKADPLARALRKASGQEPKGPGAQHLVVRAYAGTGKTFSEIVGVAWAYAQEVWPEVEQGIAHMIGANPEGFHVIPSDEQQAIWDWFAKSHNDVYSIVYCAFNKSIVQEFTEKWGWLVKLMAERVGVNLRFATINSLGNSVVSNTLGRLQVSTYNVGDLLAKELGYDAWELKKKEPVLSKTVNDLVGLCKLCLTGWLKGVPYDPEDAISDDDLDKLCLFYDVELNGQRSRAYPLVRKMLSQCLNPSGRIDFDDQNWLPVVLDLPIPKVDLVLVDEGQDLNRCKQEFCLKLGRRVCLVGDVNQSVYGFAGADVESIPRMERMLQELGGVEVRKLTQTRRCSKAVVREAQKLVPDFEPHESNPEGVVREAWVQAYNAELEDGDMVLSRVNAPLISHALRRIKEGKKAVVRGRDFGGQLIAFVQRMKASDVADLVEKVDRWASAETDKELRKRFSSEAKVVAISDKQSCIEAFAEGSTTVKEVIDKVNLVFSGKVCPRCQQHYSEDLSRCPGKSCQVETVEGYLYPVGPKLVSPKGVLFSSVHRAKGLEAKRVFLLRTKDAPIPHPMAKLPWEQEQEQHLLYVARTRAAYELVYVTDNRV